MDTGLDKVSPLGDDELVVVLQHLGVGGNEGIGLHVADGDALSSVLLGHVICFKFYDTVNTMKKMPDCTDEPHLLDGS